MDKEHMDHMNWTVLFKGKHKLSWTPVVVHDSR